MGNEHHVCNCSACEELEEELQDQISALKIEKAELMEQICDMMLGMLDAAEGLNE